MFAKLFGRKDTIDVVPSEDVPSTLVDNEDTKLGEFIESTPIAVIKIDLEGKVVECNQSFRMMMEKDVACTQSPGNLFSMVVEGGDDSAKNHSAVDWLKKQFSLVVAGESLEKMQSIELKTDKDNVITVNIFFNKMQSRHEGPDEVIAHLIDITEQKNLELRFSHSQKMQAVGQLAGGIAHDFNNLLTAMIGFCDLLLMRHPAGDPSFADIMQIKQNANRAAGLVRQLLAFSRKQTLQPKMLDITEVMAELSNLIRRLIGENIELNMVHGRDLGMIRADQGQLEQVVINLAVNARDAMKAGGVLTIASERVEINAQNQVESHLIAPENEDKILDGRYVLIKIIDTGHGMSPDLVTKIFEPFFSTKKVGEGTGLGLATVYGIVKQTGGSLYVGSEEGVGTSFYLYLPEHEVTSDDLPDEEEEEEKNKPVTDLTGAATILLVEDEAPVRIFAVRALRNKGYEVLEAESGEQAIEVFSAYDKVIDIIVTDVVMPGMNGPTMIAELEKSFPEKVAEMQVIFVSGYAEETVFDDYGEEGGRVFNFLPKPFTLKQLASKIKEVLHKG